MIYRDENLKNKTFLDGDVFVGCILHDCIIPKGALVDSSCLVIDSKLEKAQEPKECEPCKKTKKKKKATTGLKDA